MLLALSRRRVEPAPGERPHFFPKPAA
jgi:hypothetical protein